MNEAKMILKMFEEGKITLEEAESLLEALGMSSSAAAMPELEHIEHKKARRTAAPTDVEDVEELLDEMEDRFDELDDELDSLDDEADCELDDLEGYLDDLEDAEGVSPEKYAELRARVEELRGKVQLQREKVKERRRNLKEQRKEYKRQYKDGIKEDIRAGLEDITRSVEEFKRSFDREGLSEIRAAMREISEEMNNGMNELHHGLHHGVKEAKRAFRGRNFWDIFNGILGSVGWNGPGIDLEEELQGSFDPALGEIEVDLKTCNGRIEIFGTDEADYKVKLTYKIFADNEEEAQRIKTEMVTVSQAPTHLKIKAQDSRLGSAAIRLFVPKDLESKLKAGTSNGRIVVNNLQSSSVLNLGSSNGRLELANLRLKELHGSTSNGRIEVKDVAADVIDVETSNGSIYIEGICENISAVTSNGTISVYPHILSKGDLSLRTSNGRIKVVVNDEHTGLAIDAKTTMGSIALDFPNLEYQRRIEKHTRSEYQASSKDFASKEKQLTINASTSMGSISVGKSN